VIALDDYPYAGIDFREDPNMPLPPGSSYEDIGMKTFFEYLFFLYFCRRKTKIFLG
jgi:hypothetical protein